MLKSPKQLPKLSETAWKISKKVAETAEIPKTAPKPNPKAEKNTEKSSWNRKNLQNSLKIRGFWHNSGSL